MLKRSRLHLLILGDLAVIAVVTLIGFATHKEVGADYLARMAATFGPLAISWLTAAWALGLFDATSTNKPQHLWRFLLAVLFAGPLAALLRSFMLNTVVIPIFALVLTATSALGLLLWRSLWGWIESRNV